MAPLKIDNPFAGMFDNLILVAGNLAKTILGLGAAIAAVVAAFAGLRGWELKAIANIKKIGTTIDGLFGGSITGTIAKAMDDLRLGILRRVFGIGPEGKVVDYLGKDGKKLGTQTISVADAVSDAMRGLRTSVLNSFGIGADGKLITVQGADGTFKSTRIGRLVIQMRSFFRPFTTLSEGLGKFFSSKFFKTITDFIGGSAGAVLKAVNRILWPIGFLFSAYEGITDFMNSDKEGFIARLGDGFAGFFGDFIGAPFDLLKAGVRWIWNNVFGLEPDENGKVPENTWAGWFSNKMGDFSFENTIKGIVSGAFDMAQAAFDWVKGLFMNPTEQLGLTGFGENLSSIISYVGEKLGLIKDLLGAQIKYEITAIVNGFKNAFDKVFTFINNLGDNLYIMMSEALQFNFPGITLNKPPLGGDVLEYLGMDFPVQIMPAFSLGMGNEATRAVAQNAIDTRNAKMHNRIRGRNNETSVMLEDVERIRADLMGQIDTAPVVVNNIDNSTNSSVNQQNRNSFANPASPVDTALPARLS